MKMKLTTFMFSLLLAVGWTGNASAQLKAEYSAKGYVKSHKSLASKESKPVAKQELQAPLSLMNMGTRSDFRFKSKSEALDVSRAPMRRAPRRAENNVTAKATLSFDEADAITYDWVDANGGPHPGTKLTAPATDPYQIAYLLGTTYMNPSIPGLKYSAVYDMDNPYRNIEFGWDIPGNDRWPSEFVGPSASTTTTNTWSWTAGNNLPSGWSFVDSNCGWGDNGDGTYYVGVLNQYVSVSTFAINIPASMFSGYSNIQVVVRAKADNGYYNQTISVNGSSKNITTSIANYTWTNVDASNGITIDPTDSYTGLASITITGTSTTGATGVGLTIAAPDSTCFKSITVTNQSGTTLQSWNSVTAYQNGEYNSDGYYTIPNWTCSSSFWFMSSDGYVSGLYGYLYDNHIHIPADLLTGSTSITVTINAYGEGGGERLVVNGEEKTLTTTAANYTWTFTDLSSSNGTVIPPTENGYTVFLVKVKDNVNAAMHPAYTYSWNNGSTSLISYLDTYIDEVQLLTDGTRLNENTDDAGTMFAYSGELNRFYFLGKGNDYWWGSSESDSNPHLGPTYDMYEEFSPTTTEAGDQTDDFYSKLLYGNSYNVIHDCRGMNYFQHYFSMSGLEGSEHRSMTNLIFWIPDNRGSYGGRNYDEEYLPHVGLYTITLEATAVPDPNAEHQYLVTCDWVSSLNTILDFPVDQDYELWIYVYDEEGNPVEQRMVTDDLHNTTTYTYPEPQYPESYTIVYRVYGWPSAATNSRANGGDFYAKSNLDPVLIPGYKNFLALDMNHYESDFAIDEEHNYYRNFLTVSNQNPDNALTASRIEAGEDLFTLYRFDATVQNPQYTKAADLKFAKEGNKIKYMIDYANQYYIDDAHLYNEASNSEITGYKDLDALGYPTEGEIATISDGGGEIPTTTYDDITITIPSFYIDFNSILVQSNGTTVEGGSWTYASNSTSLPSNWGGTVRWTAENSGCCTQSGGGTIIIPHSIIDGKDNVTIVISARKYSTSTTTANATVTISNGNPQTLAYTTTSYVAQTSSITPSSGGTGGFELLNDFLDNSTYTQVGQVVFEEPWKSINVKLQDESAGTSAGYFLIQSGGKLRFIMPAGYNNANLRFVIHNAPVSSNYYDGTFTLTSSTGDTQTITIPVGSSVYGDRDYEAIFTGISTGDVITIKGTHTVDGTLYNYSPDFKYIHVYVQGGTGGISENTALNLAAIKFVDQFKAETREDKHPYRYGYVLKFEPEAGSTLEPQESAKPEVPVQHTGATLAGYYSLSEIDQDKHIGISHDRGITMNVMNSEVNMKLTSNPQVYYYTLDRKPSTEPDANYVGISKLQKREDDTYQEMDNILDDYQNIFQPVTTPRFDNYDVKTGLYNDYMSYVPIVWTHGEQQDNRRIKWNTENRHNSYGAPIWKTGVGDVVLRSATAEKQVKGWNTSWQDGNTKCSLYMLDGIEAWGYLPTVSNIEYEPYMFRVFVESENGKLRNFKYVTQVDEQGKEHKVIVADATTVTESKEPLCVWSAYVNDPKNNSEDPETPSINGVEFSINGNEITFKKNKVDRTDGYDENGNPLGDWDQQTTNAIFGALDDLEHITQNGQEVINPKDLNIFVRFYYIVKGMSQGWTPWNPTRNAPGLAPAGYGAESPGKAPGHATAVNEVQYLGEIVSQTYYNVQGMVSDKPFDGVNIVVTRFGNGTTSVSKIVR